MRDFITATLQQAATIFDATHTEITNHKSGGGNFVTKQDMALETFIVEKIREKDPKAVILSEEVSPSVTKANTQWILDPLDGTTNAVFGIPHFAISLAYMENNHILAAGAYDLPTNTLYFAERNNGSFRQSPYGKPEKLQLYEAHLKNSLVITGCPYTKKNFTETYKLMDKTFNAGARLLILGSAVVSGIYVAEQKSALYFEYGVKPWDIAAISLIIEEAGGKVITNREGCDILHPKFFAGGSKTSINEFLKL